MSINDYAEDLESAAHYASAKAHAIEVCQHHSDVVIRVDTDAERRFKPFGAIVAESPTLSQSRVFPRRRDV
jgi:hypothetical protein